jgi:hypothetical protein
MHVDLIATETSTGRFPRQLVGVLLTAISIATASVQNATASDLSGPSTIQNLEEFEARHSEFDSFGWPPKARFGNDNPALQKYVDFNRKQWDENGIGWLVAPTLMFQQGTQGGQNDFTANYQHNLLFVWRPVRDSAWGTGTFVFNYLQVYQLSSTTGMDMTNDLGLGYPISDSVADSEVLKALYWQQDFPDGVGDLKFGHIDLSGIVVKCSYMCDDTQAFIAGPLSNNMANTLAGPGWGVQAGVSLGSGVQLEFGLADAKGDGTLNDDRDIKSDELAYAAAISANNLFPNLGDGSVRLAAYYVDQTTGSGTTQPSSSGFVLNAEQDIGDIGYSIRYARAEGRLGSARHTGAASMVWKNPFGNGTDWLGWGLGYVQPADAGTEPEYLTEVFYRTQLTPLSQLSAGTMLVESNKNTAAADAIEAVFNFRFRVAF